jgi:hypothetical protein
VSKLLSVRLLPLLAALVLAPPAFAQSKPSGLEEAMSHDGLQKIKVKGLDLVYARPGAALAGYDKVRLDPVEVSFAKNWNPNGAGSRFKLSTEERESIRAGVAKIVYDEFVKALQVKSGYQVVSESGPDVLRVKVVVANLYVNAPDTGGAGISRTYTTSAGEMTLVQELYDSESGQVLARVVDRRESRNAGTLTMTNSASNAWEASNVAAIWARILRDALDKAHGIGRK